MDLYQAAMEERQGRPVPKPVAHWWEFERRGAVVDTDYEQRPDAFRVSPVL